MSSNGANSIRLTCASQLSNNKFSENFAEMCPHCSTAQFDPDEVEPHWKCKKYNVRLTENENNWLKRCDECLTSDTGWN